MELKSGIRQAVEKFANDSGYSGSIVEPYAVEIANLIDTMGETKYRELAALVYRISTESQQADGGEKHEAGPAACGIAPDLKAEIIRLIREELEHNGIVSKRENSGDEAAAENASTDPDAAKKHFESVAAAVFTCMAEDISNLINEKFNTEFQGADVAAGPDIIKMQDEKFITFENVRENGPGIIFRISARSLLRVAAFVSKMDRAAMDEKISTLNLDKGDSDAIAEECAKITASVNRARADEKSRTGGIIIMDVQKEKELFGEGRFVVCRYKIGSQPDMMGIAEILVPEQDAFKL